MIDLARRNATSKGLKPPQVSFILASLEELSIESNSIDWVISNWVINHLTAGEMWRVLNPGGRAIVDGVRNLFRFTR
jgi:arsenite methyltransferase